MNSRLILSWILSVLCLVMVVDRSVSAPVYDHVTIVSPAKPADKEKLHRSGSLISSEALAAQVTSNSSPVYFNRLPDWDKRSSSAFIGPKIFLLSQFGLSSLEEFCFSCEASAPPLYLVNRVFLI